MAKKDKKDLVRVNLGCGSNIIKDWVNIDAFYEPQDKTDFVKGDVRSIPLSSNSVDYVLLDNVLEHLSMEDIPAVFYEIKRILRKGGHAIIIVPDFKSAIQDWLSIDHDKTFNPFYYKYLSEVIYGNQIHEGEYHRTPMTPGFLNYVLHMTGNHKYEMIFYPKGANIPDYPGIFAQPGAICRNAAIVLDITKE